MTTDTNLILGKREFFAVGHSQLPFNQILPCYHLRNGMFHLQTSIHFHKIKCTIRLQEKLYSTCSFIIDSLSCPGCSLTHLTAQLYAHSGGRCLFNYFLVTPLDRAVPLGEINSIFMFITENLNLHMARLSKIFFYQHPVITKTIKSFTFGSNQSFSEFL